MRKGMKDARAKVYKALLASPGLKGGQRVRDVSDAKVSSQRAKVSEFGYEKAQHRRIDRAPTLTMNELHRAPELRGIDFDDRPADIQKLESDQEKRNARELARQRNQEQLARDYVQPTPPVTYNKHEKGIILKKIKEENPLVDKKKITKLYNAMTTAKKNEVLQAGKAVKVLTRERKEQAIKEEKQVARKAKEDATKVRQANRKEAAAKVKEDAKKIKQAIKEEAKKIKEKASKKKKQYGTF